jgi:hypothetical protein
LICVEEAGNRVEPANAQCVGQNPGSWCLWRPYLALTRVQRAASCCPKGKDHKQLVATLVGVLLHSLFQLRIRSPRSREMVVSTGKAHTGDVRAVWQYPA